MSFADNGNVILFWHRILEDLQARMRRIVLSISRSNYDSDDRECAGSPQSWQCTFDTDETQPDAEAQPGDEAEPGDEVQPGADAKRSHSDLIPILGNSEDLSAPSGPLTLIFLYSSSLLDQRGLRFPEAALAGWAFIPGRQTLIQLSSAAGTESKAATGSLAPPVTASPAPAGEFDHCPIGLEHLPSRASVFGQPRVIFNR